MIIYIDNNEQKPYSFLSIPRAIPYKLKVCSLDTGDYVVDRCDRPHTALVPANCAVVERKSLADLYGTASRGRARFERELQRMEPFGYRAIVIEAEWSAIMNPNGHLAKPTKMTPQSMLASLLAWQQRFHVHIIPCPGRDVAERMTFRILERWYRDGNETLKSEEHVGEHQG